MTLLQLQYFLDAAQGCNFTKAAEKNFISQSAITQQIKSLEHELGVELFIRDKRKVQLSPAGHVFIGEAEAILARMLHAKKAVRSAAHGEAGMLQVGFCKGYEVSEFPGIIQNYCLKNRGVNISLTRESPVKMLNKLENKELDVIFVVEFDQTLHPTLDCKQIAKYPLFVALPRFHPLAYRTSLRRQELALENIIANRSETELKEDTSNILQLFLNSGYMPNVVMEEDIDVTSILLLSGMGIAIVPEFIAVRWKTEANLICIPLQGDNEFIFSYAVWDKQNTNPALKLFVSMLN